jgi:sec-independent protein translocase protein TatB
VFNVGPFEMLVLAAVALIVFGPDKLPQLAKDAARMLRTLRDLAQGARSQLNDELGPEFADIDLRSLNPRTAIRNALLGDEELPTLNPREVISRALRGEDDPPRPGQAPRADQPRADQASRANAYEQRPAADPTSPVPYDPDAT